MLRSIQGSLHGASHTNSAPCPDMFRKALRGLITVPDRQDAAFPSTLLHPSPCPSPCPYHHPSSVCLPTANLALAG